MNRIPALIFTLFSFVSAHAAENAAVPTFQENIAPIFKEHCTSCHNPDKLKGDLDLTSQTSTLKGGSSGVVAKPGSADSSLLYQVMAHLEEPPMPPKKPKLDEAVLNVIKQWIAGGCKDTANSEAAKSRDSALSAAVAMPANLSGPGAMPEGLKIPTVDPKERPSPVIAMASSPRSPLVAISKAGAIALLQAESLAPLGELPFPEGTIHSLRFSPSGEILVAAGGRGAKSGVAVLFDVKTGKRLAEVGDESTDSIISADISADHQRVVCGGSDKRVHVYDVGKKSPRFTIKKHTDWVTAVAFSPDGNRLATGDRAGGLHLWDGKTGTILYTLAEHQGRITSLSWRTDGNVLASSGDDGKLILWDTEEGWAAKSATLSPKAGKGTTAKFPGVLSANFGPDGRIATVCRDKIVRILTPLAAPITQNPPANSIVTQAVISYDGKNYLTGDMAGEVKAWPMPVGKK